MVHESANPSATIDRSSATYAIDTAAPLRLNVSNDAGSVRVSAVDRRDLLIRSSLPMVEAATSPTGLRVVVTGQAVVVSPDEAFRRQLHGVGRNSLQGGWMGMLNDLLQLPFLHHGDAIDIEVEVPAAVPQVELSVASASGDVDVLGIRGQITVRNADGDLTLRNTAGSIRVDTASGDTTLAPHRGGVHVSSASGDLRIEASQIDQFVCNNADGDVMLNGVGLGPTTHKLNTVSGDLVINLLPSVLRDSTGPVGVAFSSVCGDVHLGPGFVRLNGRAIEQTAADQTVIRARSVSGDLVAHLTDGPATDRGYADPRPVPAPRPHADIAPWVDTPPAQAPFAEDVPAEVKRLNLPEEAVILHAGAPTEPEPVDRLSVLRQLEQGTIGIDEAMRLLEGLDAPG